MGRTIVTRCQEHEFYICLHQMEKSVLAEHCINLGHQGMFEDTTTLAKAMGFWDRIIRESIEIALRLNMVNIETQVCD